MTAVYVAEPTLGHTERERDTDLSTKRGQLRFLMEGLGVTRGQANALLRAYILDQRDADARNAAGEEFGSWLRRRGDIIQMRSKPRASSKAWRVTT